MVCQRRIIVMLKPQVKIGLEMCVKNKHNMLKTQKPRNYYFSY